MTRVRMVLAGLVLAVGLVSPAEATPPPMAPSTPRQVVATEAGQDAGAVQVSWKAPISEGRSRITAYALTYAPVTQPNRLVWTMLGAGQHSMTLRGLQPGQRYLVQVAADNRWGRSAWVRTAVEVRAPDHREALFAVDEQAHSLVRFALPDAAAPTTVLPGVTGASDLEIDAAGNAYLAADGTVTLVPVAGSPSVVGSGTQVETDGLGNVYLGSSAGVVRIAPDGGRTTITTSDDGDNLAVDAKGTVTVAGLGYNGGTLTTLAPGAQPVQRSLNVVQGGRILGDRLGTVYDNANSGGGAQLSYWLRVPRGSSDARQLSTRLAEYGATVAGDDSFYVAESGSFCPAISEYTGGCQPNREVLTIARYAPDGNLVSEVPTSGFSTRRGLGISVAVDSAGTLYAADRGVGDQPGLVRVPSAGGPAQRAADGEYALLTVG